MSLYFYEWLARFESDGTRVGTCGARTDSFAFGVLWRNRVVRDGLLCNSADPWWQYVRVSYGNNYYFHEANMDIVRVGWSLLKDLWHQFMAHI